jgi:hypothetical protein
MVAGLAPDLMLVNCKSLGDLMKKCNLTANLTTINSFHLDMYDFVHDIKHSQYYNM